MPRITIKSPDDIRREVNAIKQQRREQPDAACTTNRHGPYSSYYKRRALSTDLTIDFGQQQPSSPSRQIQASDLATLIEGCSSGNGSRLESLNLEHCEVVGDFDLVLQAFTNPNSAAKHLKTFASYACRIRNSTQDMVALGEALATLPHLSGISLGLSYLKHQPAWKILTPIVQNCKELNKVFVNGFYAPRPSSAALAHADNNNNNNNNNSIQGEPTEAQDGEETADPNQEVVQFFHACAASTSLTRLLCLPMLGRALGDPAILQAVGEIIRHNKSIETLELYILDGTSIIHLAEDLKHNTKLKRLALVGRHSTTTTTTNNNNDTQANASIEEEMEAFCETLTTHNFTLKELAVEPWNDHRQQRHHHRHQQHQNNNNDNNDDDNSIVEVTARQKLDFQLSLNRMNRNKLLNNLDRTGDSENATTTDDWIEAISNKDDISIIYYFLRKNPNLCDSRMWTTTTTTTTTATDATPSTAYSIDYDALLSNAAAVLVSPGSSTYSPPPPRPPATATGTGTSTTSANIVAHSPVIPRVLLQGTQRRRRNKKKRSREEMERESPATASDVDEADTTAGASTSAKPPFSATTILSTTAYTAAVFAAGYWFRGVSHR